MTIAIALLGLIFLIVIHELGHYWAARAVGVKVERFSLFFGPALVKWRRQGVEWRVGTIPLGGYVKIAGTERLRLGLLHELAEHVDPLTSEQLLPLVRELDRCHDVDEAQALLDEVERLLAGADLGPRRLRMAAWLDDARERAYPGAWWLTKPWRRVVVGAAGPAANVVLAFLLMTTAFMIGGAGGRPSTKLEAVSSGSAAAQAGIVAGDRIVTVDGRPATIERVSQAVASHHRRAMQLTVVHDGQPQSLSLTPRYDRGLDRWLIGVQFGVEPIYYSPWSAAANSFGILTGATSATASLTAQALQGQSAASGQLVGPVGVVKLSASSLKTDARVYPGILALLSLSLAILNLLPILPLDGGQILVSLIEGLRRGRRMAPQTEAAMMLAGMGVVLLLMMVSLGNDFSQPGGQPAPSPPTTTQP